MGYELAADLTALIHLAFIAFILFGAFLGRRSRPWRIAHIGCMSYGIVVEAFSWYCPLTYLEQYLRRKAGRGLYEEPFITHYLNQLIYPDVAPWSLVVIAIVVLLANLAFYFVWFRRPGRTFRAT